MDRTGWIVIIACSLGLYIWFDTQKKFVEEEKKQRLAEQAEQNRQSEVEDVNSAETGKKNADKEDIPVVEPVKEQLSTISNQVTEWVFTNVGGGIKTVALNGHDLLGPEKIEEAGMSSSPRVVLNQYSKFPIGALSEGVEDFKGLNYEIISQDNNSIVFQTETPEKLQVTKTFILSGKEDPGSGHVIDLNLEVKYLGVDGNFNLTNLFIYAGSASQLNEGKSSGLYTGFEYMWKGKDKFRHLNYLKKDKEDIQGEERHEQLSWVGVSNQFFTTNIYSKDSYEASVWATRFKITSEQKSKGEYAAHGAVGLPKNVILNPGEARSWKYEIYAGPKDYKTLKKLGGDRTEIVGFDRMPIFGVFAKPFAILLSWLMNALYGVFGNFGWAIISITVIMRLAIWPITAKGTRAMRKMGKLAPMMQELKEKYKDNPKKMQQETMNLYKDYGVNPIGGCLPLLLQMPIFIGYFAMLRSAVELRHEPWLGWVTDLAAPDTVGYVAGLPINVLPLLMGITMKLQMSMTPQTGGQNQKQMQIIMTIMPIFITVICYNFASALALYWTAGNIFSIGQTWASKKFGKEVELKKVDRSKKRPAFGAHQPEKKRPKRSQIRTGGGGRRKR